MNNKPAYIMRDSSITVFVDGKPQTIDSSHMNFLELRQAILDADYDKIPSLISIKSKIENMTHGNLRIVSDQLFYKNHELHGVVVDKLFDMLKSGAKDASPLLNFIERLTANPSSNSVDQLYNFLEYRSLPITPEGKFLAYKGVKNDFYSKHGNPDTLVVQGTVNTNHEIYNGVGETIVVARNHVDDNKDNTCSFGLHVGSYDYANNWAGNDGRLLVVEVDPADAVSVPTDCERQKLRVSKYKVISDITVEKKEISDVVYGDIDDSVDESESCDESCDACDCQKEFDFNHDDSFDHITLKIRNYVDDKHALGVYPTIKAIQSRMKDYRLSAEEIYEICRNFGFETHELDENNNELPISRVAIVPSF